MVYILTCLSQHSDDLLLVEMMWNLRTFGILGIVGMGCTQNNALHELQLVFNESYPGAEIR